MIKCLKENKKTEFLYRDNFCLMKPWLLMDFEKIEQESKSMNARYSDREVYILAKRIDTDDCLVILKDFSKFMGIHDFADMGWEVTGEYNDFWQWLETAIGNTKEYFS